ncbi:hypothetical protein BDM02DRAFT_3149699 [Thelephora ganbajun]|uniref:Uncharacterized protein n=1 Tax=Thelephora ganbajun TaxID=370292 RepID=A0ACB6Z5U7_THEGA|nr:hypothetical protein BDM02DRAFT_3149699 [Thelephora ganbajun]
MSSSSGQINYAHASGINSVAAAVIFAVFYGILLPYYLWRAIRNPTYVLIILSLFCAIRVTAFVMRAVLAGSSSAGTDVGLVIGESIVYSVGFFGLLYSAYLLVLDRDIISGTVRRNPISRITSNRHLIRLALVAAVVIGITGSTYISSTKPQDISLSKTLRKVSVIIFLVVTALLAVHTLFLVRGENAALRRGSLQGTSFGTTYGMYILCLIVIFLLIREIYLTATISSISRQNEAVWYPLAALPELLAVFLFAVPGLVPEKKDLIARAHDQEKNLEATETA